MIRSILPVGQGNCAVERHQNFTVLYDCGGNDNKYMENIIRKNFNKHETVEALFISHLDSDHINGVDFLMKYCNVRNIFIPYVSGKSKIETIIRLYKQGMKESKFVEKVMNDDLRRIGDESIIFTIPEYNNEKDETENEVNRTTYMEKVDNILPSQIKKTEKWCFLPFNYRFKNRNREFWDAIKKSPNLHDIKEKNIAEKWNYHSKEIKDIYKNDVTGDINTNSMVVYSGPSTQLSRQKTKLGALFLGDFNLNGPTKIKELLYYYHDVKDLIGFITIPHHGSMHSFNEEICLHIEGTYVNSAGHSNKHHHPHKSVLIDLIKHSKRIVLVDEISCVYDEYWSIRK